MTLLTDKDINVIAYRNKTGCEQYCFGSIKDMYTYFNSKCYEGEFIQYHLFDHDDDVIYTGGFYVNNQ